MELTLTAATCGENCWSAAEEVCKCSCSGANHGCLRSSDGVRPVRSSKVRGKRFELLAVGTYVQLHDDFPMFRTMHGDYVLERHGLIMKKASPGQVNLWPELQAFKDVRADSWRFEPYAVWHVAA